MSELLSVRDLSVDFRLSGSTMHAVKSVSFDIKPGETMALVGESGSGKSVTALSILQLLPYPVADHPSGSIRFKGTELVGADEKTLREVRGDRISMIFQEPMTSLNPLHSIEKQINETLFLHKGLTRSAARKRTLELLRLVGLPEAEKRLAAYPHELSGGQRQRVMIAMALANEPDLLIADEPTTALDVTIQAQILELLKDLQRRFNMALLLITHDLGIVRKMADNVCVMSQGEIVEKGTNSALFAGPKHPYTQRLLAAEPKGNPAPPPENAADVMTARDIKVHFPIKKGLLRRTVDYVRAVDGIDVTVREGHTVGVVGESGSGKTTLGLALLRLHASQGAIRYDGKDIQGWQAAKMRPLRREMQVVFQDPYGSLSPRLSVAQIIEEGLKIHGIGSRKEREAMIAKSLEEVGPGPLQPQPLPARVLRRPAPAHRHRPRHGAEAPLRRAGRADLGPGHVRPGADRRSAEGPSGPAQSGLPLHQPRSEGRQGAVQRGAGDEGRQGGRIRPDPPDLRGSAAGLYPRADRRGAQPCGCEDR